MSDQSILAITIPSVTVLVGILISNSRIGDLNQRFVEQNARFDQRFDHLETLMTERLRRVEEVIDARLTRIEQELKIR